MLCLPYYRGVDELREVISDVNAQEFKSGLFPLDLPQYQNVHTGTVSLVQTGNTFVLALVRH